MDEFITKLFQNSSGMAIIAGVGLIALRWFATNIAIPLRDRHVAFVDSTQQHLAAQEGHNSAQRECTAAIRDSLKRIEERQEDHFEVCRGGQPKPQLPPR